MKPQWVPPKIPLSPINTMVSGFWVFKNVSFLTPKTPYKWRILASFFFQKMIFFYIIAISILIFLAPQFLTEVLVTKCRIEFTYFWTPKPLTNGTFPGHFFAFSKNAFFLLNHHSCLNFLRTHSNSDGRPAGRQAASEWPIFKTLKFRLNT